MIFQLHNIQYHFFGLQTKFTLLKQQITIIVICCSNTVNLVWRPKHSIEYCVTGKSSFFSHKPHLVCVCVFFLTSFFSAPSRLCWHFKKLIQHLLTCKHGTFFVFVSSILDIQRWYGLFKIMFRKVQKVLNGLLLTEEKYTLLWKWSMIQKISVYLNVVLKHNIDFQQQGFSIVSYTQKGPCQYIFCDKIKYCDMTLCHAGDRVIY